MSMPAQARQPMEHTPPRAALRAIPATRLDTKHQRTHPSL
ncbi:hypothetical protein JOE33_003915 [Pseudomonas sp. PvP027]|nr:hypothetical protein [Pseudomonas sp. PvP027]